VVDGLEEVLDTILRLEEPEDGGAFVDVPRFCERGKPRKKSFLLAGSARVHARVCGHGRQAACLDGGGRFHGDLVLRLHVVGGMSKAATAILTAALDSRRGSSLRAVRPLVVVMMTRRCFSSHSWVMTVQQRAQ